jgi:hypothetical protein
MTTTDKDSMDIAFQQAIEAAHGELISDTGAESMRHNDAVLDVIAAIQARRREAAQA